jgi:hypothetical protein
MSAQIVHAVKRAIELNISAETHGTPNRLDAVWPVLCKMPHRVITAHFLSEIRDSYVRNDAGAGSHA